MANLCMGVPATNPWLRHEALITPIDAPIRTDRGCLPTEGAFGIDQTDGRGPATTAPAAIRISDEGLVEVKRHLDAMREAQGDVERLSAHDAAFHRAVVSATGDESLLTCSKASRGVAAALLHVSNTERWVRAHIQVGPPERPDTLRRG
ncbi:FCD domain-containing protein [Streptomyces scabiei]|nr:FCD domain-containing protein [Streptomyces griseiscabiei]